MPITPHPAYLGPITHHADNMGPITRHGKPLCHPAEKHKQNNNSWVPHPLHPWDVPTPLGWPYTPGIGVSRGLTVYFILVSNVLSMRLNLLLLVMLLKKGIVLSISHLLHPRCNVRITCPVRGGKQKDCFGTSRVGRSTNDACALTLKNWKDT